MQVQVNTGTSVEGHEALSHHAEGVVRDALERFSEQVTRVEIHLSDVNGQKAGDNDKRCLMEARPAGMKPLIVSHNGANLEQAVSGCLKKLVKMLNETKDRLDGSKGSPSFAGDQQL